jgi:stringent starvation protein B
LFGGHCWSGPDRDGKLQIGNDFIDFQAFQWHRQELSVLSAYFSHYARENGAGMSFEIDGENDADEADFVVLAVTSCQKIRRSRRAQKEGVRSYNASNRDACSGRCTKKGKFHQGISLFFMQAHDFYRWHGCC